MTREKSYMAKSSSSGFSLFEMAIVIAISSILLVSAIGIINTWMKQAALTASQQYLNTIQQALANYETQHHRLPCPSSFIAKTSDPAFGREITYPATTGCGLIPPANIAYFYTPDGVNTYAATGRTGSIAPNDPAGINTVATPPVIIGAVPVRDLGLPDSYRTDPYGYMYSYAITQSDATAPMNAFAGAIDVVDKTGASVLPHASDGTPGTATYVVVDHGKDGKGAFTANSTAAALGTPPKITCASAPGLDQLNCDFETGAPAPIQFRAAQFSRAKGANWFDDAIVYNTSLSSSTQTCTTVYSAKTALGTPVIPGASLGYNQVGYDSGFGFAIGWIAFVFMYWDTLYFAVNDLGYNPISPTAVAYCPASYNVVAGGGCTQTLGGPVPPAGPVTNSYGLDINPGTHEQIVLPPLSHPAMPNAAGQQGWECNGSSALGMETQAYASCCTGG